MSTGKLGSKSVYASPALGKTLPQVIQRITQADHPWLRMELGTRGNGRNRRLTTIQAGPRLRQYLQGLTFADFGCNGWEQTIILREARVDYWHRPKAIEYIDTSQTRTYRAEIAKINQHLQAADIGLDPTLCPDLDPSDRRLRRIFNGSVDHGGRLGGGFWSNMDKTIRPNAITIDGRPIVTLDYGQAFARIVYGFAGATPPPGDLYNIPDLEGCRDGVKLLFNALLFASKPLKRYPKDAKHEFPSQLKVDAAVALIERHHHQIAHLFRTKIGFKAMKIESDILVDVLITLGDLGICGLPLNDAVMVANHHQETARSVMISRFLEHAGLEGVVGV